MSEPPALPAPASPRQLPSLGAEASGSPAGNPSQMQPPLSSLHNCRADAAREAAAQTQVVPPAIHVFPSLVSLAAVAFSILLV